MKYNMSHWLTELAASRKHHPMPILSFPVIQLMGISVKDFLFDADLQAEGMRLITNEVNSVAGLCPMDLSVEAEAFGCQINYPEGEVPTVITPVVHNAEEAKTLVVPEVGSGRTGICINAAKKAVQIINDRPVFAGVIGPFSLAGRLMGVNETLVLCYEEPEMVHDVTEKATGYLAQVISKYKDIGASGVVVAEPLAGILSPKLAADFSHIYMKRIIESVQSEEFAVIYHNCGNNVIYMAEDIFDLGAMGYHFGNSIKLGDMLEKAPSDSIVMGNVDPSIILNGSSEEVKKLTMDVLKDCDSFKNFVLSTGCDIAPMSPWDNIHAFFDAVTEYYES